MIRANSPATSAKGQYFSFDAIVATVIVIIAVSSLLGYWFSAQSIIESRANPMYADALRVAETLMSPGVPADWQNGDPNDIRQLGLTTGRGNELRETKIARLKAFADPYGDYAKMGRLLGTGGFNYYITVNQSDVQSEGYGEEIGNSSYAAAGNVEVVVAHRGGTIVDPLEPTKRIPVKITVYLYR